MNVLEYLVIFWKAEDGNEEVQGIYLYGLMRPNALRPEIDSISAAWKPFSVQCKTSEIESELGPVLIVDLRFDGHPNAKDLKLILDKVLTYLLNLGAIVVWAGGEDCTWSPDVLDPESHAGNVLAAKSSPTGFLCNVKSDGTMEYLDDSQLGSLWSFIKLNTVLRGTDGNW